MTTTQKAHLDIDWTSTNGRRYARIEINGTRYTLASRHASIVAYDSITGKCIIEAGVAKTENEVISLLREVTA